MGQGRQCECFAKRHLDSALNPPLSGTNKEAANHFRLADSLFAARSNYFFAGGKSVQLPCATSAAMPMLSPSVGWGWMVLPISTASAPISMASAISPIMSPACVPTMPPPKILPWPWASGESSNSSLVTPSSRPLAMARPEAVQGNKPFFTPCFAVGRAAHGLQHRFRTTCLNRWLQYPP